MLGIYFWLEKKALKAAKLFNLVTQDEIGSNFSIQYLENQAYLNIKFLRFFLRSWYLQDTKKLKELVMVTGTTCWTLKLWLSIVWTSFYKWNKIIWFLNRCFLYFRITFLVIYTIYYDIYLNILFARMIVFN